MFSYVRETLGTKKKRVSSANNQRVAVPRATIDAVNRVYVRNDLAMQWHARLACILDE